MATSRRYIAKVLNATVEACPTAFLPASKDLVQSKLNIKSRLEMEPHGVSKEVKKP